MKETPIALSQRQRRLAAIMFTDVAGYTALGQRNEPLSLALVEAQKKLIRPVLSRHRGREVKNVGDAFLVEFSNALDAVRCAYDIQRSTREFNISLPDERRLHLRIGLHLGDVTASRGDIQGDAVNVASRIESLAEDGGVCLTRQVFDHVQNKFELPLKSLGEKPLKNIRAPLEVYKMVMPWEQGIGGTVEFDRHRVAVLPFKNLSPDPTDAYFADGMTEEVITALSRINELTVIASSSVMQYKNSPKRVVEVGRELRTGSIIEGSVRKSGNKVRIAVQMVDPGTEGHLWAENYDRKMDDIFGIQTEIAESVADALKIKLIDSERRNLQTKPTKSVGAYNLYMKGRYYWNERSEKGLKRAIDYFNEAVKKDPDFALGYAGLADAYYLLQSMMLTKIEERYLKPKEYASKALSINKNLAEAHTLLAHMGLEEERDFKSAEAGFRHAISLNPNYPTAHQWYALLLEMLGRKVDALAEVHKALELDPLSPVFNSNLAFYLYALGDYHAAIEQYRKVHEIDPTYEPSYYGKVWTLCRLGKFDEALGVIEEFSKLAKPIYVKELRAYLLAFTGKEEARKLVAEVEREDTEGVASPYHLARTSFLLGQFDRGFALLAQAFERHEWGLFFMKLDYELDPVRSDPRYVSLVKRLGLNESNSVA